MTDGLAGYRRLIDMTLMILHLEDVPELQISMAPGLLDLMTDLDLESEIPESFLSHLTERVEAREPPTTLALIALRDRVISLALEKALDLGLEFEWTRDLEDSSISRGALARSVTYLAAMPIGDPEAALEVLLTLERLETGATEGLEEDEFVGSVTRFFESVREHFAMARLVRLEDTRVN